MFIYSKETPQDVAPQSPYHAHPSSSHWHRFVPHRFLERSKGSRRHRSAVTHCAALVFLNDSTCFTHIAQRPAYMFATRTSHITHHTTARASSRAPCMPLSPSARVAFVSKWVASSAWMRCAAGVSRHSTHSHWPGCLSSSHGVCFSLRKIACKMQVCGDVDVRLKMLFHSITLKKSADWTRTQSAIIILSVRGCCFLFYYASKGDRKPKQHTNPQCTILCGWTFRWTHFMPHYIFIARCTRQLNYTIAHKASMKWHPRPFRKCGTCTHLQYSPVVQRQPVRNGHS